MTDWVAIFTGIEPGRHPSKRGHLSVLAIHSPVGQILPLQKGGGGHVLRISIQEPSAHLFGEKRGQSGSGGQIFWLDWHNPFQQLPIKQFGSRQLIKEGAQPPSTHW